MVLSKKYYSTAEAATLSGLSRKTLREGCKSGRFPHLWIGRVLRIDLQGIFDVLAAENKGLE